MQLEISLNDKIYTDEVLEIYKANKWSSSEKQAQLMAALQNSHSLVTARISGKLVGLGNAISDGHLVVYYPHLLVHPSYQRKGIGKKMMQALQDKYSTFHQQVLTADVNAIKFYTKLGFVRAGNTASMWIYLGNDH
jgi:GNAT superfamily N-acetyltransferase